MLSRVDGLSGGIAAPTYGSPDKSRRSQAPWHGLNDIPGISLAVACVILAEIGTDMTRFPPPPGT